MSYITSYITVFACKKNLMAYQSYFQSMSFYTLVSFELKTHVFVYFDKLKMLSFVNENLNVILLSYF